MDIVELATVASGVSAVSAVILSILDRQERRRRRQRRRQTPPSEPQGDSPPGAAPVTGPTLGPAPTAWGPPVPPVDTGRLLVAFEGILAYVLGIVGGVAFLFSRHREVRYHALQSLGIDVLTLAYLIAATIVGVTYSIVRYGSEPLPNDDPVLNATVAGLFVVELLPRFYCVLQILRAKPARVLWVWRIAATLAMRRDGPAQPPTPRPPRQ